MMKSLALIAMLALPNDLIVRDTGPRAAARTQVPAGATIQAFLENDLASNRVHAGDTVVATLPSDLYAGDYLVAPAGARLFGRVTYAASARETRDKGVIALQFDALERAPGEFLALRAPVSSAEGEAKAQAEETRGDAIMIVGGAILGGVLGNQVGRDRQGRRDARILGALAGASLGYLVSTQSGADFTLRRGTRLVLTLTRDLDPAGPTYTGVADAREALSRPGPTR